MGGTHSQSSFLQPPHPEADLSSDSPGPSLRWVTAEVSKFLTKACYFSACLQEVPDSLLAGCHVPVIPIKALGIGGTLSWVL